MSGGLAGASGEQAETTKKKPPLEGPEPMVTTD